MARKGVVRQIVWVAMAGVGMAAMEGNHWTLNESTKLLRAMEMIAGFKVTSASRTRGREEIELGIRGPSCL